MSHFLRSDGFSALLCLGTSDNNTELLFHLVNSSFRYCVRACKFITWQYEIAIFILSLPGRLITAILFISHIQLNRKPNHWNAFRWWNSYRIIIEFCWFCDIIIHHHDHHLMVFMWVQAIRLAEPMKYFFLLYTLELNFKRLFARQWAWISSSLWNCWWTVKSTGWDLFVGFFYLKAMCSLWILHSLSIELTKNK